MKRLMTLMVVALLSLGVASISVAQEGTTGEQPAASQTPHKAKKHTKKHHKKGKKAAKKHTPAAEETK